MVVEEARTPENSFLDDKVDEEREWRPRPPLPDVSGPCACRAVGAFKVGPERGGGRQELRPPVLFERSGRPDLGVHTSRFKSPYRPLDSVCPRVPVLRLQRRSRRLLSIVGRNRERTGHSPASWSGACRGGPPPPSLVFRTPILPGCLEARLAGRHHSDLRMRRGASLSGTTTRSDANPRSSGDNRPPTPL
jgi:hypothetical protein